MVEPVPSPAAWTLGAVTLLLQATALLWRRTAPRAVLLAVALGMLLCGAWGLGDAIGLAQPAVLVAAYTLGVERPLSRRTVPTFVAAAAARRRRHRRSAGPARRGGPPRSRSALGVLQGVGDRRAVRSSSRSCVTTRREIRQARASRADALEREQDALVQAAVARERTAMARELHDIAAHHLSGIAVMTAAIGTQIDTDPAGAKAAVAQVRQQSTAVLRDLRSLVGLLRERRRGQPATPTGCARSRSPASPRSSTTRSPRAATCELTVLPGDARRSATGVGPLAQLAAYRMVQESLANAARHAPGARAEVVRRRPRPATPCVVTVAQRAPPPTARRRRHGPRRVRPPRHARARRAHRRRPGRRARPPTAAGRSRCGCRATTASRARRGSTHDPGRGRRRPAAGARRAAHPARRRARPRGGRRSPPTAARRSRPRGRLRPDVVCMDIRMPGQDGISATRELCGPGVADPVPVLVLTTFDIDDYLFGALEAGASGFLLKDAEPEVLVAAVRTRRPRQRHPRRRAHQAGAARGGRPAGETRPVTAGRASELLTARELDILLLLAQGLSNDEIAARARPGDLDGEVAPGPDDAQARRPLPPPGRGLGLPEQGRRAPRLSRSARRLHRRMQPRDLPPQALVGDRRSS